MPIKITTETQLLRLLGNSPLQVEVDFMYTATYSPVEQLSFEQVAYWDGVRHMYTQLSYKITIIQYSLHFSNPCIFAFIFF